MNKYYIPKVEEFFVGFEFEILENSDWIKSKFNIDDIIPIFARINNKTIISDKIRVKYLDKDDIESLDFAITKDTEEIELSLESKRYIGGPSAGDDYRIIILYGLDNKELWIYKRTNSGWEDNLFKGIIKNKSELIKLLKQLGIG